MASDKGPTGDSEAPERSLEAARQPVDEGENDGAMPVKTRPKSAGYWKQIANVERELRQFIGDSYIMPTAAQLNAARRSALARAISRAGGFPKVARMFSLKYRGSIAGRWNNFSIVEKEIRQFMQVHGIVGRMPTHTELKHARRIDLRGGIGQHGGMYEVAQKLGLPCARKPANYYKRFSNLALELGSFMTEQGLSRMPKVDELTMAERRDLVHGIETHGGFAKVAGRMNVALTYRGESPGYWRDFDNIEREILGVNNERGVSGKMPSVKELKDIGKASLVAAISKYHGGWLAVADRLDLRWDTRNKPAGYWKDWDRFKEAVLSFSKEHCSGTMPTTKQLNQVRGHDLVDAIHFHGGTYKVAARLGLKTQSAQSNKSSPYRDKDHLRAAIVQFNLERDSIGLMPTQPELVNSRKSAIARAIEIHGGFPLLAEEFGLRYVSKTRISGEFATHLEQKARAIQTLAESHLLSGAQIMMILRRAGLLEYRNSRIVRLSASIARGDHDEIETAITKLANGANDAIQIEESDELTVEEAEVLLSSLDDDGRGLLTEPHLSSSGPDTAREQAVIRGLSALGHLRLPLDNVLSLLASKVLWEAFYKRLYAWYGSLDAAQNIRGEDVEAAIFSAYPEHAANEFVSEVSALFTREVEQAVNFAASLHARRWSGRRLRLHQADAARRMAEVLSEQNSGTSFLLNADDPGMGKSAAFLAAACASGVRRVIIVAPKTVADDTWVGKSGEIRRCLPMARIVRGLNRTLIASRSSRLSFFVLHYEELLNAELVAELAKQSFDCLCLDEIHFIKQRAAQESTRRRAALESLRASARTAIGLSGTPLINELSEPMSLLQTLSEHAPQFDHSRLSSRRMSDIADVFEAMLPYVIRRRKAEVLLHLAGCDVRTVDIPLPDDIEEKMCEIHKEPRSQATKALVKLRKLSTDAKLPYLLGRSQAARKLLILTYLTDEVSAKIHAYLEEFLPNQVAHINGQTPDVERKSTLDSFRATQGVRILVGTIRTIGAGLTLFDPASEETASEIIMADLPYTWAEFEQGIARLYREGQKQRVTVDVLQTTTTTMLRDGSHLHTLDEKIWALIAGKRQLSDIAIDGKYDTTDADAKVRKAMRRWLKQAREIGVEPLVVERRPVEQTEAQRWRSEIGRLRALSSSKADEVFADPEYTEKFLAHLKTSRAAKLSHQWLRGRLSLLTRPDFTVVDMGCGLNPFADFPCRVIGLDRHNIPGQLCGKMEAPPLPDNCADILIYSLSLYGAASDLLTYFAQATRILRGGGHLFIVEPASSFTDEGLARFVKGLKEFGFDLVGGVKDLRGDDGIVLKAMHLALVGELDRPDETAFERKY